MRQKIENKLYIDVEGAPDLTLAADLVVWVVQGKFIKEYKPRALSEAQLLVEMPFDDCCSLSCHNSVKIQLAGTDADGNAFSSDPVIARVGELLKEEGYCGPT